MISFTSRYLDKICKIVFPGNPSELKKAVMKNDTIYQQLKEEMARIAVLLPR